MRTHRSLTAAALLVLSGLAAAPASADLSLDVSPVRVQMEVRPGAEYTNAVEVQNTGHEPARIRAYIEDWYLDEKGTPIFQPVGTQPRTACPWIQWGPSDFLVEPGQTKFVRLTVQVPEGTPDGGYHGSLVLESVPMDRDQFQGSRMFVRGRIACMVYVRVGNPSRSAEIVALDTVIQGERRTLRLHIRNTGEDVVRLAGDVACLADGKLVAERIAIPDVPVLPDSHRWVEFEVPSDVPAAGALARVTVDLKGIGRLLGECSLDPERATLVK